MLSSSLKGIACCVTKATAKAELSAIADAEGFQELRPYIAWRSEQHADTRRRTEGCAMLGGQSRRAVLKWAGLAGGAALAGGLLPRSAGAQDVSTLTVGWGTDIDSFDPAQFKSDGAYIVQCNIHDTVLAWGTEPVPGRPGLFLAQPGKFVGGVGESWAYENDGKTLAVKIRRGLKFPNGKPVDAHAVKYLFDRGLQSPGYTRLIFPTLLGVTQPDQFEVRDDTTFVINL